MLLRQILYDTRISNGFAGVGIVVKYKENKTLYCYEINLFKLTNVNLMVNSNLYVGRGCIMHEFTN